MKLRRPGATWFVIIVALCLAGAWISGQLVKRHANLWRAHDVSGGFHARVCEIGRSAGLTCWPAEDSGWNAITLPVPEASRRSLVSLGEVEVPVAFFGLSYFIFLGVWFAFVGRVGTAGGRWHLILTTVAGVGLLASLICVTAMAFGAAPRCLWCWVVHVINMLMGLAIWRLYRGYRRWDTVTGQDAARNHKIMHTPLLRREAFGAVATSLVLISGMWLYRADRIAIQGQIDKLLPYKAMVTELRSDPEFLLREHFAQERFDMPIVAPEWSAAAEPQLVVFVDYECPACYCNSLSLTGRARELFDDHLHVAIRHFPLSRACNRGVSIDAHPNACKAAHAVEAARLLGGEEAFWRTHGLLLQNQKRLDEFSYVNLAEQVGLDRDAFIRELRSERVQDIIQSHIALAEDLGVRATPTMFLNGRQVSQLCQTPMFWKAISERLADGIAEVVQRRDVPDGVSLSDASRSALPE